METVETFAFVLLSFSEVVDVVSCVDLGIEVSGKFFHGLFVTCLRRCLQACRKSRRLRDRCNVAIEHVFVLRLRFPFLQLDSRNWPAISSTLGPRCRLDVLGKAGKSGARPPCGRMFVRIVLSALWDLSRFVRTLGRELLCPHLNSLTGYASRILVARCGVVPFK